MYYLIIDKIYEVGGNPFSPEANLRIKMILEDHFGPSDDYIRVAWNRNGFHPFLELWSNGPEYVGWLDYLVTNDLTGVVKANHLEGKEVPIEKMI